MEGVLSVHCVTLWGEYKEGGGESPQPPPLGGRWGLVHRLAPPVARYAPPAAIVIIVAIVVLILIVMHRDG